MLLLQREKSLPIGDSVYRIAHTPKETKAYCKNIVKTSKLLDQMAAKARAEVLRIEAARLEAHRLLLRRKADLSNLVTTTKGKSSITR